MSSNMLSMENGAHEFRRMLKVLHFTVAGGGDVNEEGRADNDSNCAVPSPYADMRTRCAGDLEPRKRCMSRTYRRDVVV